MKQLPRMQTENREINQLQTNIIGNINPILKMNPQLFGNVIQSVSLQSGQVNYVNIGLSTNLQGWTLVRKRSTADVWDNQDTNKNQGTLALQCSANVVVDVWVW